MMTCNDMVREVFDPRVFVVHDYVAKVTKVVYSAKGAVDRKSPSDSELVVAWND